MVSNNYFKDFDEEKLKRSFTLKLFYGFIYFAIFHGNNPIYIAKSIRKVSKIDFIINVDIAMSEMAEGIQDRDRRLREAVNMKTTLIKEIHHRVKNNLQIVMSLLSIQANQVQDAGARDALLQAQTRINALALVHRILNELEDQSTLDIRDLLDQLAHQIAGGMSNDQVKVEVDVPSRVVTGSVAVALALFTVEVLTNIFKHAFPEGREGVIRVSMAPIEGGKLKLEIADNGLGFAMEGSRKSVGSRLIKTFGLQLGGVSTVQSEPGRGTVVDLVFPDPDLKPHDPTQV